MCVLRTFSHELFVVTLKGTLHFHLLIYGGLSAYAMQRFAAMKDICAAISDVLNSMFVSEIPSTHHLPALLHKLAEKPEIALSLGERSREVLLSRHSCSVAANVHGDITHHSLKKATYDQGSRQQHHKHLKTCRSGKNGRDGCRLCMGRGDCICTRPVLLQPLPDDEAEALAMARAGAIQDDDESVHFSSMSTEQEEDNDGQDVSAPSEEREEEENIQEDSEEKIYFCEHRDKNVPVAFRAIADIPEDVSPSTYSTTNVLHKVPPPPVIVWETSTAPPDNVFARPDGAERVQLTRDNVLCSLKEALANCPEFASDAKFWDALEAMPQVQLDDLYLRLVQDLQKANRYIGTYNCAISFCTGAHNNAVLLGGDQQAKSATFYMCPYMGKMKFPLQHSLIILDNTLKHVENHPSVADDSGTPVRTAKQILQRVLNKMNLHMELSGKERLPLWFNSVLLLFPLSLNSLWLFSFVIPTDYQMAAVLLRLPSIIRSEVYGYLNPEAGIVYRTHIQLEDDREAKLDRLLQQANNLEDQRDHAAAAELEDFIVQDSEMGPTVDEAESAESEHIYDPETIFRSMGFLERLTIQEEASTETLLIPRPAFYRNRGKELRHLNEMEYEALIDFRKKGNGEGKKATELDFGPSFKCAATHTQYLRAKQRTIIVTRKAPHHPGKRPTESHQTIERWKEQANRYARFYLSIFRPETECYDAGHENPYSYDWDALEEFVDELSHDDCIISKFRLMQMHTHMKGFFTPYRTKLMLSTYRRRCRDNWNKEQQKAWEIRDAWERQEREINNPLRNYIYSLENADLGEEANTNLLRTLRESRKLQKAFQTACDNSETHDGHRERQSLSKMHVVFDGNRGSVQEKGARLRSFDGKKSSMPMPVDEASEDGNSGSNFERNRREKEHKEILGKMKMRQRQFYDVYEKYLDNPYDPDVAPPKLSFLHGSAGTGKSTVLERILEHADFRNRHVITTAFNAINAIHLKKGKTTASIIHLKEKDAERLQGMNDSELQEFAGKLKDAALIIIDEVSNQAPFHLAKLSYACQQATNNFTQVFGGLHVILAGDFIQLGPVKAGHSFPAAVMLMCENVWCKGQRMPPFAAGWRRKKKKVRRRRKGTADDDAAKYISNHPFSVGASLIKEARLCELNEQVRSVDEKHTKNIRNLYLGNGIKMRDLLQYKFLSQADYRNAKSPWLKAPIIVRTHRERFTLTHEAAVHFAKKTGTAVVRWMVKEPSLWAQRPPDDQMDSVLEDPCFYEYWVAGADAYLNGKLSGDLGLVNAQGPFQCHSLTMSSRDEEQYLQFAMDHACPGEVITLREPPLSVNLSAEKKLFTKEQLAALKEFELDVSSAACEKPGKKSIVIPIVPTGGRTFEKVPIPGGQTYRQSKVNIHQHFPFYLNFVITVNRSEGQTMDNVILAISHREGLKYNFSYLALYVALSRVREGANIRLLVVGDSHFERCMSLDYVTSLKPPIESYALLEGFRKRGGPGWEKDMWRPEVAYSAYINKTWHQE